MHNRLLPPVSQAEPLIWAAGNLDSLNEFILASLRRGGGNEEKLLTEFFSILRAKRAIRDGLSALQELEAVT